MTSAAASGREDQQRTPVRRAARWLPWLFGAAMLGAVIYIAIHFSEVGEFGTMLQRARPRWLLAAVVLQLATYETQGETWRAVARRVGWPFGWWDAFQTSLAKLFTDQALPSLGISGSVVMAQGLQAKGMPRSAVMAGVIVTTVSFHAAYVASLIAGIVIAIELHHLPRLVAAAAALWILLEVVISVVFLVLAGRGAREGSVLARIKPLRKALKFAEDADPRLSRNPWLLLETSGWQLSIVLLDAATIWVLIAAMGQHASAAGVLASFVFSTLVRNFGIVPGGLGTFEASSVLTLKLVGVSVPAALSATLLFRGLSFWLPMIPGLYLSRRMTKRRK